MLGWLSKDVVLAVVLGLGVAFFTRKREIPRRKGCLILAPNDRAHVHLVQEIECEDPHCSYKSYKWLISWIDEAERSIAIMLYFYDYAGFTDALLRAKDRGVRVKLIIQYDKSDEGTQWYRLARAGVAIRMQETPPSQLLHVKMVIIDYKRVIFGSMNWTKSAITENNEEVIAVEDRKIVSEAFQYYERIWSLIDEHNKFITECMQYRYRTSAPSSTRENWG